MTSISKNLKKILILSLLLPLSTITDARRFPFVSARNSIGSHSKSLLPNRSILSCRGGAETNPNDENDDERYSRQVYTLGARAHGLVRSCTIYMDGPSTSGLVYECAKNLALSGVGNVELWTSDEAVDENYHQEALDDLGKAYQRAARSELDLVDEDANHPSEHVLAEYIKRLNPSVHVSTAHRPLSEKTFQRDNQESRGVLLCIDRPYSTQVQLNQFARKHNLSFVAVETAGVYGRIFCDFGPTFQVFDVDGETPLITPLDHIERISASDDDDLTIMVHSVDAEKHDVSKGDKIQFQLSNGDMMPEQCTVIKVLTPYRFQIRLDTPHDTKEDIDSFCARVNEDAVSFSRIKIPVEMSFSPLEEAMQTISSSGELFTPCDLDKSFDESRRDSILSCFQAISQMVSSQQRLPTKDDAELFQELVQKSGSDDNRHVQNFLRTCAAKLTPLQAMFAAVGAQEAMKAVTGLYNPVQQMLLYDCDELLSDDDSCSVSMEGSGKSQIASSGLAYILGRDLEKKVKSTRLFVVGAGAIGCELLKNLAAMGIATGKKGCLTVTDMDTIEKSNLSRQLLFRDTDIGQFKSIAAKGAVLRFNPAVKMEVHTGKVGDNDSGPFDEEFWSSGIQIVLNALDNMEARLFIDQQCVTNGKALVDAGTLGSKGNVQVVVPNQSESYGSSIDPPEPAIPVCTLKNFPYAISHTIQWGRDLFDGLFQRRPRQASDYADSVTTKTYKDLAASLIRDLGDNAAMEAATELQEDLSYAAVAETNSISYVHQNAITWAAILAMRLFRDSIHDLLREHPVDSLDEDGEPFWSGTRKVPRPVSFSTSEDDPTQVAMNQNLVEFVKSAARLRIEMLAGATEAALVTEDDAKGALEKIQNIQNDGSSSSEEEMTTKAAVRSKLKSIPEGPRKALNAVEFEKDDESNGHVQFVTAASNLRAICYGIPPVDAMETRRVAGRIVPAMVTTTAVVSGLSCIELLKLLQDAPLTKHRNAFINLALPFFAFTAPLPAEEIPGPQGKTFTVWDNIVIDEKKTSPEAKGLSLKRFLKKVKKAVSDEPENLEVSTVSAGHFMIYANFLHEDDKEMLRQSIWDLVERAASDDEDEDFRGRAESAADHDSTSSRSVTTSRGDSIEFSVTVEDTTTGEEFELPPVRIRSSVISPSSAS